MTVKLCECGCGEAVRIATKTNTAKGYIKGQPFRFVCGHGSRVRKPFSWVEEDHGYETPCWMYQGFLNRRGYGNGVFRDGHRTSAHRYSWIQANGPIPDGLFVLHHCDNPTCVRPDHLFLGTAADNIADKFAKGRDVRGEDHAHAKLTDADVRAIRDDQHSSTHELAARFGVSTTHIRRVKTHKAWTTPNPPLRDRSQVGQ